MRNELSGSNWHNLLVANQRDHQEHQDHLVCQSQFLSKHPNFALPFFFRDEISIIRKKCVLRAGVLALRFTSVIIAVLLSVITLAD